MSDENKNARPVHVFDVPEDLKKETGGVSSIGMVELEVGEELMATRRAAGDGIRLAWELAQQSLVAVDGAPVNLVDGSTDVAWKNLHPKIRQLIVTAYSDLHSPKDAQVSSFLKSRRIVVA